MQKRLKNGYTFSTPYIIIIMKSYTKYTNEKYVKNKKENIIIIIIIIQS